MTTRRRARQYAKFSVAVMILTAALLAACEKERESPEVSLQGETMGTTYSVKVVTTLDPEEQRTLQESIEQVLERVNNLMSTYRPDSELSRFNQYQSTEPFPISPETAKVFDIALQVSRESNGAFDVTVGPLVNAWGFGPDTPGEPPTDAEIAELRAHVGYDKLNLNLTECRLSKRDPQVYCDLSAVAKGYGVDAVAALLEELGHQHYMVEIGGEVRARGVKANGEAWKIGIYKPVADVFEPELVLELTDAALATSGDYRNFRVENGQRLSHEIDPSTGRPVTHGLASATVVHESCAWADAYATALMVLGPEEGYDFAVEHDLATLFMIHDAEGTFQRKYSPVFSARFPAMPSD